MRRGEILNIKKSHINYSKSVLLIHSTKTDQPRTIPLSSQTLTALRGQLRASQRVSGGVVPLVESTLFDYKPRGLSGEFLKLCRRKGIDNLHFHDLRHEATSRLFEKGLNPVEVATITGYQDADAVHAFKGRGFSGEVGLVTLARIKISTQKILFAGRR